MPQISAVNNIHMTKDPETKLRLLKIAVVVKKKVNIKSSTINQRKMKNQFAIND